MRTRHVFAALLVFCGYTSLLLSWPSHAQTSPSGSSLDPTVHHTVSSGVLASVTSGAQVNIATAVSGKFVYLCKLTAYNASTSTAHTISLTTSGTVLARVVLSPATSPNAGGSWCIDDTGFYQSLLGAALGFTVDTGGSAADIQVTAETITAR